MGRIEPRQYRNILDNLKTERRKLTNKWRMQSDSRPMGRIPIADRIARQNTVIMMRKIDVEIAGLKYNFRDTKMEELQHSRSIIDLQIAHERLNMLTKIEARGIEKKLNKQAILDELKSASNFPVQSAAVANTYIVSGNSLDLEALARDCGVKPKLQCDGSVRRIMSSEPQIQEMPRESMFEPARCTCGWDSVHGPENKLHEEGCKKWIQK